MSWLKLAHVVKKAHTYEHLATLDAAALARFCTVSIALGGLNSFGDCDSHDPHAVQLCDRYGIDLAAIARGAEEEGEEVNAGVSAIERAEWAKSLNRRAEVEQELLNVANGKAPLPDREQCRAWAMRLGVPDDWHSFGKPQHRPDPATIYEDRQ